MIIKQLPDDIWKYWPSIKYAVAKAHYLMNETKMADFMNGLLVNLLTERAQCWAVLNRDDPKDQSAEIKCIIITKILFDGGGRPHLFVDSAYVFKAVPLEERAEYLSKIVEFAKNNGCDSVYAWVSNEHAADALKYLHFKKEADLYCLNI